MFSHCTTPFNTKAGAIAALFLAGFVSGDVYFASNGQFVSPSLLSSDHESCPINSSLSCSAKSQEDSCCYESTNGIILSTQFWDYYPQTGGDDVWTLHGLWNDKCAGGYNQFCDKSSEVDNVTAILENLGYNDLLTNMTEYWKNRGDTDESLWMHEWNKHGTCMYTLKPLCYSDDAPEHQNVADFFSVAYSLYEQLGTYDFLDKAGIYPSINETWTVKEFQDAIEAHTGGYSVYLGCDNNNAIDEVWYFFHIKGSVAGGTFIPTDSVSTNTCKDGFHYYPKGYNPRKGGGGGGGDDDPSTKAFLKLKDQPGCLISNGNWYISGTCATFTITTGVYGAHLTTSKGPCNIVDGALTCGKSVTAGDFTLSDKDLVYGGESTWSADHVPKTNEQVTVNTGDGFVNFTIYYEATS